LRRRSYICWRDVFCGDCAVTDVQWFAFVILPAAVVALAWGAVVLNEHVLARHDLDRK
jgi:hypothetical protein